MRAVTPQPRSRRLLSSLLLLALGWAAHVCPSLTLLRVVTATSQEFLLKRLPQLSANEAQKVAQSQAQVETC